MIYCLFIIILHHIYLLLFYNNVSLINELNKTVYKYILKEEQTPSVEHSINVYKMGNKQSKNVIIFLSGAFSVSFDTYVQKMVTNLLAIDYIKNTYQLIVFEKLDKQTFISVKDFETTILTLNDEINIEELTLFGFSTGGVVASHIMASLKSLKCKKKIITYDTPYQVLDNVLSFEKNTFYRPDYYFYYLIHKTYLHHYNYEDIKHFVKHDKWSNGASDFLQMIFKIHNLTENEFYKLSGFNFEQDKEVKIIQIYCKYDPIVNRTITDAYIKDNIKSDTNMTHDCKKCIGHCSDMWSSGFDIISIINHIRF